MAPRRFRGSHRSGGEKDYKYLDMKCANCNHPVSFITGGIRYGPIIAAVVLTTACLGSLILLWCFSWKVKRVYPREASALPRKFAMNLSFVFCIIYEALMVTQVTVGETSTDLKASFMIFDASITILRLLVDFLLTYTVVGSLWARYKATRYPIRRDSARAYGGSLVIFVSFIILFEFPVYVLVIKSKMFVLKACDPSLSVEFLDRVSARLRENNYIYGSFQILARLVHTIMDCVTLGAAKKLVDDHREHKIPSKIPWIFLYTVSPALLLRDLSSIGVIASQMAAAISTEHLALVYACTHDVLDVFVLAALVWAGLQPDAFMDLRSRTTGIPLPRRTRKGRHTAPAATTTTTTTATTGTIKTAATTSDRSNPTPIYEQFATHKDVQTSAQTTKTEPASTAAAFSATNAAAAQRYNRSKNVKQSKPGKQASQGAKNLNQRPSPSHTATPDQVNPL